MAPDNQSPDYETAAAIIFAGEQFETTDPELAIRHYLFACENDDVRSKSLYRLGKLYIKLGRYRKAVQTLREANKLTPDHADTIASMAKAILGARQYKRSLRLIQMEWSNLHPTAQHAGLVVAAHALAKAESVELISKEIWQACPTKIREPAGNLLPCFHVKFGEVAPNRSGKTSQKSARMKIRQALKLD